MTMKPQDNNRARPGRIPAALQAIFLASNGGEEVNEPPKNMGFKVFSVIRRKNKKQVYDKPVKNHVQVIAPIKNKVCQSFIFSSSSIFQSKELSKLTRSFPFLYAALNGTSTSTGFLG
jgi:hypothetical protein